MARDDYDAIGGVEGALAKRGQAIFDDATHHGMDEAKVRLFRRLFTRLVALGDGSEDMHPELTRRGEEEHPPLGLDPGNLLERQGRLFLGWSDMSEALADVCHWIGENMLAAVNAGHTNLDAVHIPKGLLFWWARIAHYLTLAADSVEAERTDD